MPFRFPSTARQALARLAGRAGAWLARFGPARVRAEAALYRALAEYTADPVYMLDPRDGFRMVYANDACCRHYGLPREALYRLRLPDWDPNFGPDALDALWRGLRAKPFQILETEHHLPDGRVVPVEVSANYLLHRGRGFVAGYFRDISGRKHIENALRESEARFRTMADAAPVLIWLADTGQRHVWFNQGWLDFTGRTLAQEYGAGWTGGVHPEDLPRCLETHASHCAARLPFRMEYRLRRHDGVYRWLLDSGCPRFNADGAFHGYIGSCIDITERMEVDRMKSDFLSTAAHELRTPLASIYGFSELLLSAEDFDPESRREMLQIIFRQSKLISALVNELLDLARIEARRGKDFVFASLDPRELLRETVSATDPECAQGRCPVRLDWPDGDIRVRGDANKLRQALTNVLSNAYKYSPGGGGIDIVVRRGAGEIGIEIADHGIGMAPEQVARVCERFYRADSSGAIPGTGLGMSIVKEIVTLHRGRLDIRSQPGAGTQVAIWLPDATLDPVEG
ncbi:ATP-binding protein [Methylomagnum ishizawai]|uniref:ATP-binding protein n=1 Tax=Methylomagnum ishizawai TaxID=1760988 RepID=UPI001C326F0A|nr:ATP-binding protein [Methylomagnum ishizawai]BBL77128.1 hypothetical protein MishRS11D_42260 [Methylomagnum ishizawai]